MATDSLLQLRRVTVRYGGITALDDVSMSLPKGELTAIVGPNGAGKSTLLNAITGHVPLQQGEISYRDRSLSDMPPHIRTRGGIAHVPEGRGVFGRLTVTDNLRLAFEWGGSHSRREWATAVGDAYGRFPRLHERRRLPASSLSGGEQQMLAIARALIMEPDVLLLDEPSLGLAPLLVREVFEHLSALKSEGHSIVLVEQNVSQALRIADSAYLLSLGKVVSHGSGRELLDDATVRESFLPSTDRDSGLRSSTPSESDGG